MSRKAISQIVFAACLILSCVLGISISNIATHTAEPAARPNTQSIAAPDVTELAPTPTFTPTPTPDPLSSYIEAGPLLAEDLVLHGPLQSPIDPRLQPTPTMISSEYPIDGPPCMLGFGVDRQGTIVYLMLSYPAGSSQLLKKGDKVIEVAHIPPDFISQISIKDSTPGWGKMFVAIQDACASNTGIPIVFERDGQQMSVSLIPNHGEERDMSNVTVEPSPDAIYL